MSLSEQMKHRDKDMVPRVLVVAMFSLMAASLGLVAYAQWAGVPNTGVIELAPVERQMTLQFETSRQGVSTVYNEDGEQIAHSADDLMGFVGVMGIALKRERLVADVPNTAPVILMERTNGTYAIEDPVTGWSVELIGYGADNVAAFARLLD
ncbi:photosynthetic complex assembly protein PuhC [Pseudooctadecabacter jejudonensis]|uniref:Photosynthetic complex assembly protein n=1 Tax=Pseudooctadecabacter jejudonensis TaxID=1391910 RepID=A0A1Y5S8C2_9RHOB|nr:photosynthetic complex assembly protein PuhC [Pseudooctadecabacter jejudonensis]SLN32375.1 hypothetical protein PSJ8397_01527 [Pseudooctadecabacter jejudonensis]